MKTIEEVGARLEKIRKEICKIMIGQEEVIDLALITVMSGAHALIEGVPGIAKTLLVRTMAKCMDREFKRIQFTPDLMPSDISGTNVFNFQRSEFSLVRGPVFTSFLLADEINRAPAKTQSALLQAMQERSVTIDGVDHQLDASFTVFATQNPIEYEGTYPLPEAQKDRFMLMIRMGFPEHEDELELAMSTVNGCAPEKKLHSDSIEKVISGDELPDLKESLGMVTIKGEIVEYIVNVVRSTRSNPAILSGASPRATQSFILATRALALLSGRSFVTPDDVKALAVPVLAHRIMIRPEFEMEGLNQIKAVENSIESVGVPR